MRFNKHDDVREPIDELAANHATFHAGDGCRRELFLMGDTEKHAIHFFDELEAETLALRLVPGRSFLELDLGDRFDPEVLHGFRRIASTAARARATESSRE
ncbi:MAG: hypothetical protein ACKV2T_21615 [Kofleriaceae bacterium]